MKLYASPPIRDSLFELQFYPNEEIIEKAPRSQEWLSELLGRVNRVLVGVPQVSDVLSSWPQDEPLEGDLTHLADDFDFLVVRLACSFVPDRRCRFVWARLGVELSLAASESSPSDPPIAFDLYPRDVIRASTIKRSYEVKPTLNFAFAELSAKVGGEKETMRFEPQITAAGLLTSTPTWTFNSEDRSGLVGSREMFVMVKKPKGEEAQARFTLGAELNGRLGPIPVRRHDETNVMGRYYPLVPESQ